MERADDRIVFQVEVEPGTDPIRGSIHAADRELDFVGWVGLAGALERILDGTPQGSTAESQGGSPHELRGDSGDTAPVSIAEEDTRTAGGNR